MSPEASQSATQLQLKTRHLELPTEAEPASQSSTLGTTGPLDLKRPWVVEFRVVGTASTVQARVGDAMLIGRGDSASGFAPEVDLTPFDAYAKGVSRKHAVITVKDQRLMVRDLNSTNGTRLNNVLCKPGEEYRLRHGNELMLGTLRLQVSFAVVPSVTDTQRIPSPETLRAAVNGNGKRVLIIEDDNDVGNVFRMALEYAGYKVLLVNDVTKALGVVFQGMPDAIILDLMLPDMNGLDLVRYVRKQKTSQHIPMLVVSGAIGGFQMNQALAAGADKFLGKPVVVEELVQAVAAAIKMELPLPTSGTTTSTLGSSPT
ncbi:MAG TPA: response regulator [Phototrophicaceae bacterium]|nr:response regulator [Phototrophicaceae bacterium]